MSEWISVDDKLPPFTVKEEDYQCTDFVLVFTPYNDQHYIAQWYNELDGLSGWEDVEGIQIKGVTHWQAIKAPSD